LTGNIGSGKSTVSRVFQALGVPVFHADQEAKNLYKDAEVLAEVADAFGKDVINNKGELDKARLASIIFSDKEKLKRINAIIHPKVRQKYHDWLEMHGKASYTLQEAAIMIESGLYKIMDKIIVVTAPQHERLQRISSRDGFDREEILKRMENQYPESTLRSYADFVIENHDHQLVIPQVLEIHNILSSSVA
ncbi:MAG: dephospho-CoA kinase, partial [Bacteroidota bacterium]